VQEILNKFFQFLQKEKMQKEEPVFAHLSKEEVDLLSPLVWAYIGDVVYELWVRLNVVSSQQSQVGKLHQESVKHVRAQAQASLLTDLEVFLTE
jgi:ribonuclease-3 family protein